MINKNTPLRFDWQTTTYPRRSYFARVNEYMVLNVHRIAEGSPTWEWLIVGFDITKDRHPVIVDAGRVGTMLEGKLSAEHRVPQQTPTIGQQPIWDRPTASASEELPF